MDVGKDVAGLELEFLHNEGICCSEDAEDAVAEKDAYGVEDEVVDVYDAERVARDEGNQKLGGFERESNRQRQP